MNNPIVAIFGLIVLIISVMIHEVAHGLMAYYLGDATAKNAGRLTLNPAKHLDFFGSFMLPLTLYLIKSPFLFGWAKPVPFNPRNLKNPKKDSGLIGLAGPASNFAIAIVFSIILKIIDLLFFANTSLLLFFDVIILINIALGIFNLLPIPPLDGSKVLFAFLPARAQRYEIILEQYGIFIIIILIFLGIFQVIFPVIRLISNFLGTGMFI